MSYRVTKLFRTKDKTYNEKQVWIAIINNSYKILVYLNCNCKFEEGKEPNFYFSGSSVSLARNGCDCVENSGDLCMKDAICAIYSMLLVNTFLSGCIISVMHVHTVKRDQDTEHTNIVE